MASRKSWFEIRLEYCIAVCLVAALRFLPLRLARPFTYAAAKILDRALPKLRRVAHINLSFAFPHLTREDRDGIIEGVFLNVGRLLLAIARFPSLSTNNIHDWIGYEGLENYQAAKRKGRGILVATAHLGNWELSAFAHALMTEPMNVMVRQLDNPAIDRLVEERRAMSGNKLIYKKDAARAVLKALRQNEAVGILIDQNTSASEGVFIYFFGKQACAGTGFVKFAYHSGAPVIPGFALWDDARSKYVLRFYPEVDLTGDEREDTQTIHHIFEKIIREHPEQWMWIHRRWKTRPPGEEALY